MSTRAFLDFAAAIRGFQGDEKRRRVADTVARVELESVLEQPIETLSKGFKRRVGLAQSILHDPEVLILDEPTDGLDPNQKHEVRSLIREMAPRKAIILSTHLLEEVDAVCSRAIIISAGRIVSDGTPEELHARADGHNAVTLALVGVAPERAKEALAAVPAVRAVEEIAGDALADAGSGSGSDADAGTGSDPDPDADADARSDSGGAAEAGPGPVVRLRVLPAGGLPVVAEVGRVARSHGWTVDELTVDRGRLDDVFRAITAPDRTRS